MANQKEQPQPLLREIPRLADDPEYAREHAKHTELQLALAALERRLEESRATALTPEAGSILNAAEALVRGEVLEDEAKKRHEEIAQLMRQVRIHREAVELQRRRVEAVRSRVNAETIARLLPSYTAYLRKLADTALLLGRLGDEEQAFRETLEEEGFSAAGLRPCPLHGMTTKDQYSRLRHWFAELAMEPHNIRTEFPS
jgi:hypothetical protein